MCGCMPICMHVRIRSLPKIEAFVSRKQVDQSSTKVKQ